MDEITLKMDLDRVTLNDLVMLEDPKIKARDLRDFLARCAVDKDGNPMGMDQAVQVVGNLSISKLRVLAQGLADTLREVGQVPPENGGR